MLLIYLHQKPSSAPLSSALIFTYEFCIENIIRFRTKIQNFILSTFHSQEERERESEWFPILLRSFARYKTKPAWPIWLANRETAIDCVFLEIFMDRNYHELHCFYLIWFWGNFVKTYDDRMSDDDEYFLGRQKL